ncbi:MAG TPA: hypothetical protein VM425_11800 [Myxococcota bacterium]|nr:hypothetical protein [Myxococcota bacterium]
MAEVVLAIRQAVAGEEFDYPLLMGLLSGYRNPRAKVTALLNKSWIVRVKKGLYVFGPKLARRPYSRLVLANMIYGPSCVSLQTALAHHGLIPEATRLITSVTCVRNKRYETPVGGFRYRYLNLNRYPAGVTLERLADGTPYLIASPEKALVDWLLLQPGHPPLSRTTELSGYLAADLRLEPDDLLHLDGQLIEMLAATYRLRLVSLLAALAGTRGELR